MNRHITNIFSRLMTLSRLMFCVSALLAFTHVASAQLISNPNSPVPAALGVANAYTAATEGAEAPFFNPAGLAYGNGSSGRFSYHRPHGATFLSHLSASGASELPRNAGSIAIGIQSLGTRHDGRTVAGENELYLSHGIMLQEDIHTSLAFGYSLKMISYSLGASVIGANGQREDLGDAMVMGLDVGATAQLWDRFRIAGAFRNINHPTMGENSSRDLPRIMAAGVAYTPYYGVRTTFDIERELYGDAVFKGGIDAQLVEPLHARFGVMTNPNIFTGGFGIFWRDLVIDYALLYHPVLAPSHMVGVGFNVDQSIAEVWHKK